MAQDSSSSRNNASSNNSFIQYSSSNGFDHPNTTFIQADPSTFRAIVQRLTGADPGKLHGRSNVTRPGFRLHERRTTARKLEIKLGNNNENDDTVPFQYSPLSGARSNQKRRSFGAAAAEHMVMVSPVSPLDSSCSHSSRMVTEEEEERAIAEKGYYLHPSPLSTPRGSDPPELLPLFPLHSPRGNNY